MIQTSKITQPSQYSGINIRNLGNNATINITPFTNLETLDVSSANNNISSTQLNFNTFPNIESFSAEASNRSSSNPGISFNVNGTNSSIIQYKVQSSVVTSVALKNPNINYSFNLPIGQIPTSLTYLNIEGNSLLGPNLASILLSFSGMAKNNNITGGYLNIIPYNNLGQSLTPHLTNFTSYYRDLWSNDDGKYQLAAQLNDIQDNGDEKQGNIFLSTNYGIDFYSILSGSNWRSVAASNDISRIVAVARSGKAYLSTNSGLTFSTINTGATNNLNLNYTDAAMSFNGQYINLTINGDNTYNSTGALYCSNDYGITFTKRATSNIPLNGARWISTSISSDGHYQNACVNSNSQGRGILISSDYGLTWNAKLDFYSEPFRDIDMSSDGKYQTANGTAIWVSSDYGNNWSAKYRDYLKYTPRYWIANTDFRGGITISSNGRYQVAGLTTTYEVYNDQYGVPRLRDGLGYLVTSSDYGATWQRSNFRDNWGSCNLSSNGLFLIAGSRSGILYTSRTDGADTSYGTYLSQAYGAVQYLRNIKDWTVQYINGLFN